MEQKKLKLAFTALNLLYSIKELPEEVINRDNNLYKINKNKNLNSYTETQFLLNNQSTINSIIITYKKLILIIQEKLKKQNKPNLLDLIFSLSNITKKFEDYELEAKMILQKHDVDLEEFIIKDYFQIVNKEKILSFSEKYCLIVYNSNPLYLFIDKLILSYFNVNKYFCFCYEETLELDILKSPKWFVMMSYYVDVLSKYKEIGCWTVLLTYYYLNTSDEIENVREVIESNISKSKNCFYMNNNKKISNNNLNENPNTNDNKNNIHNSKNSMLSYNSNKSNSINYHNKIFDLTSISFFNQEYFLDIINQLNLKLNEDSKLYHSNISNNKKNEIYEDHVVITNEYANDVCYQYKDPYLNHSFVRESKITKNFDEADSQGFNTKLKSLGQINVLVLASVLIKPLAFDKSLFFISNEKIHYHFYYQINSDSEFDDNCSDTNCCNSISSVLFNNNIDYDLVVIRFNEQQQVYYYDTTILNSINKQLNKSINKNRIKDKAENTLIIGSSSFNDNKNIWDFNTTIMKKLSCNINNIIKVLDKKQFIKYVVEFKQYLDTKYLKPFTKLVNEGNNKNKDSKEFIKIKTQAYYSNCIKIIEKSSTKLSLILQSPKDTIEYIQEKIKYPLIIKFNSDINIDYNHLIAIVKHKQGWFNFIKELEKLSLNNEKDLILVIESFISHDGQFVKANCLSGNPKIMVKKSIPNNIKDLINETEGFIMFETKDLNDKIAQLQNEYNIMDIKSKCNDGTIKYDPNLIEFICKEFIRFSGLTFIGLDFVVCKDKRNEKFLNYYIVDCNYFPAYKEVEKINLEIDKHIEYCIERNTELYGESNNSIM